MRIHLICLALLLVGTAALAANEVTYRGEIRKLVGENCAGCHGKGTPLTTYQHLQQRERYERN